MGGRFDGHTSWSAWLHQLHRKTTTTTGLFLYQHFALPSWPSKTSIYSDLTLISAQSHLNCLLEQPEYISSSKILHNCSICEDYARCEDKACCRRTNQGHRPAHESKTWAQRAAEDTYTDRCRQIGKMKVSWGLIPELGDNPSSACTHHSSLRQ